MKPVYGIQNKQTGLVEVMLNSLYEAVKYCDKLNAHFKNSKGFKVVYVVDNQVYDSEQEYVNMNNKYINISQAARLKGCERQTIYRNIYLGNLDAETIAGTLLIINNEKWQNWKPDERKQHKKV